MASTAAAAGAAEADGTSDTVGLLSASSATANGDGKQQQGPTTADGVPFDPKSLWDR